PKMIWHFGELGMENSLFTCPDGSYNNDGCKLDTKPQPQWLNNWTENSNRSNIYNTWSRLNALKINEAVFEGNYNINSGSLTPRIYIWNDALAATTLKNVVILANFNLTPQNITPDFPYTGNWYDLMDPSGNTSINVTNTTQPISIPAGEFRIFGNAQAESLGTQHLSTTPINLLPNPANQTIRFNSNLKYIEIFDMSGKSIFKQIKRYLSGQPLDISTLNSGIYLVKITTPENRSEHLKLVKN
ncbi:MAG: T9SS type A sorting domain-containing protein, partial [Flavobacteriaceae bacterium]